MKTKNFFRVTAIILLVLALLGSSMTTYAWLCTGKSTPFSASPDDTPDISLYMYICNDPNQGFIKQSGPFLIGKSRSASGSFGGDFNAAAPAPHFGTIDNLDPSSLDYDNMVWYVLKIHVDEGRYISNLRLNYATPAYDFWGTQWHNNEKSGPFCYPAGQPDKNNNDGRYIPLVETLFKNLGTGLQGNEGTDKPLAEFMRVSRPENQQNFITNQAPESLFSGNKFGPAIDGKSPSQFIRCPGDTALGFSGEFTGTPDANGYYYVYFRVSPNLNAYDRVISDLFPHMPCYFSFNNLHLVVNISQTKK